MKAMTRSHRLSLAAALFGGVFATTAAAQVRQGEAPTQQQIDAGEAPAQKIDESEKALRELQAATQAVRWTKRSARELLAYTKTVGEEGLDPDDYGTTALEAALAIDDDQALSKSATDTFLRLSSDLALGHVRGDARLDWHVIDRDLDGNQQYALMQRAVKDNNVRDTLVALLPTHPQYTELKMVLANSKEKAVRDKVRANLDRWRWLPRDLGPRYVIVNVPAFTAALVENGQVVARHRTVVGAVKTATPQLSATIGGVILNPWWEIPKSIEPEVRGKKGYVRVKSGNGFRYRQPPGPGNALGRVKFVMPNNYAIYLHDTPSKAAFARPARAYSHGCIRTQNPLDFAALVLDNPEWDRAAMDRQIASGKTIQANASTPTPVYITYFTAAAAKGNHDIVSYNDIYTRDTRIVASLNQRQGGKAPAQTAAR